MEPATARLNNAINRLREALNDSADEPRLGEALPRRGYGFIPEVNGYAREATRTTASTGAIVEGQMSIEEDADRAFSLKFNF